MQFVVLQGLQFHPKSKISNIIPLVDSNIIQILRKKTEVSETADVTGGLIGKLECALEIAQYSQCWITNLDSLKNILEGKPRGSRIIQ